MLGMQSLLNQYKNLHEEEKLNGYEQRIIENGHYLGFSWPATSKNMKTKVLNKKCTIMKKTLLSVLFVAVAAVSASAYLWFKVYFIV